MTYDMETGFTPPIKSMLKVQQSKYYSKPAQTHNVEVKVQFTLISKFAVANQQF